ncbi:MAG: tetratricopeptide repeat protein [Ilyomonas sp.]
MNNNVLQQEDKVEVNEISTAKHYRYPGLQPYKLEQEHVFFGRDEDIENLYRSVLQNACTVVFGKSGIGKSSVINAGLLPRIIKQNNEQKNNEYVFLRLRFGAYKTNVNIEEETRLKRNFAVKSNSADYSRSLTENEPDSLPKKLNASELDKDGTEESFIAFLPQKIKQSLWYKLKTKQYALIQQHKAPVFFLFFDQVEEIFTYPVLQIREFLFALSDLLSQNIPDEVNEALDDLRYTNFKPAEEELKTLYASLPIKFLFAIRSDKLNLITRLNKAIPSILQNMYELMPLSKRQAVDAITLPAKSEGSFATPSFTYDEQALKYITDFLDQETNDPAITYEGKTIEPFNLQIICSYIEQKIVPDDEDKVITKDEIGSLDIIIKNYFVETMNILFPNKVERIEIVQLLITHFIDSKNNVRKKVYFEDLGDKKDSFKKLYDAGMVRREEKNEKEIYYELSHDRLISAILDSQKEIKQDIEKELNTNSDDPKLYQQLAETYFSSKQYDKAAAVYTKAIAAAEKNGSSIIDLLLARADAYGYMQNIEASNEDYEKVLSMEPDNLLANFYLGFNYYNIRQLVDAERYFRKVLTLDPNYIPAIYNIGLIQEQNNKEDDAIETYKKVLELDPKYSRALSRLGSICYSKQDFISAEKYFTEITKIDPQPVDAYFNLGLIYYTSDPAKAIDNFKQVLILSPKDSEACYNIGILYTDNNEHEKAVFYLSKCVELNPSNTAALNELGVIHYEVFKDYEKAKFYYESVLKVDPNFSKAYYNLGLIDMVTENTETAIRFFEKAIELDGSIKSAYTELAKLYKKKNDFNKANEVLLTCILKLGEDAKIYNSIGVNYYTMAEDEKAVEFYKKAIALDEGFADAYFNLGLSYKMLNDYDNAINNFSKAIELNNNDFEAYSYLGEVYEKKGDTQKAKEFYSASIKIKPDYTVATEKLKELK